MTGAPQDPHRDRARQPHVRLTLTAEQQRAIVDATGVQLGALGYTAAEAAGVALLAAAVAGGHSSPASRRLIRIDLTPQQSALLRDCLGGAPATLWLVDADRASVRYGEDWAADAPIPLGRRGLVVPHGAAEPGGVADASGDGLGSASGAGRLDSASGAGRLVVRLPQVAEGVDVFGTGRHAATQLAALLLEEQLRPGDDVIDVGTGSGLLAVFAVRLGAAHVRAVDTSAAAIETAGRTVALNGCTDRVDLLLGELTPGAAPADLIVANILAGVLADLLPLLAATTSPGGRLVTSGVVDARAPEIVATAARHGFNHVASSSRGGWTASAFHRGACS